MTSVILNEGGSVIEHDEIIYPEKPEHEPEPEETPEPEHVKSYHGKRYTVVLHFH